MTDLEVSFILLCEGSSDEGLRPHLETLLVHFGAIRATGMTDTRKGSLPARLRQILREGTPMDLLFVHRDSDGPTRDHRLREIDDAIRDTEFPGIGVPVIPVQETEAWLLLDEAAIRSAVGRPRGRADLGLPRHRDVERTPRPKEVLREALVIACEHSGRRLHREKKSFDTHRNILLQRLDPFGPVRNLPSWQCLEHDIQQALTRIQARP